MGHMKTVGLEDSRCTPADIFKDNGAFFWCSHNPGVRIRGPFITEEEAEDDYNRSTK